MNFALPATVPLTPTPCTPTGDTMTPGNALAGRYEMGEIIGEGGMGMALLRPRSEPGPRSCRQVAQTRRVADSPAAARFVGEAKVTGQLQHPGIPPVHELGTLADGRPFLAMRTGQRPGRCGSCSRSSLTPPRTWAASSPSSSRCVMPWAMHMPIG